MVNENFMKNLGWTFEEGQKALADLESRGQKRNDNRICVCGHLAGAHAALSPDPSRKALAASGFIDCRPSRMVCPCEEFVPVIRTKEPRRFVRKTSGLGALHALGLGLQAALTAGVEVEWLDGVDGHCMGCQRDEQAVMPVALTGAGALSLEPQKINLLLCKDCMTLAGPA